MCISKTLSAVLGASLAIAGAHAEQYGAPITEDAIAAWDISIEPDGTGLPRGQGSVTEGIRVYKEQCAACHGEAGKGGPVDALVGGVGSLFDYIRRAMPYFSPGSLSDNEVYAVTAYLLYLNEIVEENTVLGADSLTAVRMPNREGFISWWPEPPKYPSFSAVQVYSSPFSSTRLFICVAHRQETDLTEPNRLSMT